MIFLFLLIIYFLIIGFLTIVERKIIGGVQNRVSVFKLNILGMYSFYLDFLKVLVKGFLRKKNKKLLFYYLNLLLIIFLMVLNFYVLIFGILLKDFFIQIIIFSLILDGGMLYLKILFLNGFQSKYIKLGVYRIKNIYILIEGVFTYLIFLTIFFLIMKFLNSNEEELFIVLFIILYIFITIKMFRIPSDYFEMESELVGGGVLELQGIGFLLWSLIEYGLIFNNTLLIVYLINLAFNLGMGGSILILLTLIFNIFFIRAFLIRIRFNSVINLIIFIFFIANTIIFLILLI